MSELISREALDAEMQKAQEILESNSDQVWGLNKGHHAGLAWARRLCADAPAVDAVPVAHARWVKTHTTEENVWNCSACGYPVGIWTAGSRFCPNCGAKMDGGAE